MISCHVYITALIVGDGLLLSLWVELGIGALWGTAITNTNLGNLTRKRKGK